MTRRAILYLALGGVIYAGALVATAPAPLVASAFQSLSEGRLELREPSGTAWAGGGRLYARQPSGDLADLGVVRWEASAASLLAGSLRARVDAERSRKPMRVDLGPSSVTLQDVDIELPGATLGALAPALHNLGPQGSLRVRSDKLELRRGSILGLAEVEWRHVRLARPLDVELGSHVARLRGGGAKLDIELGTLEGPLKLAGGGAWTHAAGLSVAGSADATDEKLGGFLKSVCADYRGSRCSFRYPR
jgi:hypothetical protein